MTDYHLSGEDSVLKNVWDEICVQVQGEESVDWKAYEETAYAIVELEAESLLSFEREAVWLKTEQGFEWRSDHTTERTPMPVFSDDVVQHIVDAVFEQAANWSNPRIRQYTESSFLD
jgi:hypothetical protein